MFAYGCSSNYATEAQEQRSSLYLQTFRSWLKKLHLRKTFYDAFKSLVCLMRFQIIFSSIVMHRHPKLVADYGLAGYHHADGEEVGSFSELQAVLFILCKTWHLSMKILIMSFSDQPQTISKNGYEPKVPLDKIEEVLLRFQQTKQDLKFMH